MNILTFIWCLILYVAAHAIIFFLQGLPNGPGVPTKMITDQIPPAITMATDARVNTMQGSRKKDPT